MRPWTITMPGPDGTDRTRTTVSVTAEGGKIRMITRLWVQAGILGPGDAKARETWHDIGEGRADMLPETAEYLAETLRKAIGEIGTGGEGA